MGSIWSFWKIQKENPDGSVLVCTLIPVIGITLIGEVVYEKKKKKVHIRKIIEEEEVAITSLE